MSLSSLITVAERFEVSYDGPAVEDHTIDATILGESLVALAELLHEARDITEPDGPRYRVRVREANEGSFEILLELAEWWDSATKLFSNPTAQAFAFLLTVFGKDGLFGLLLWLRGKRAVYQERADGKIIARVEDRETIIEAKVGELALSSSIRRSVRKFVGAVSEDRIDRLMVKLPGEEPIEINPEARSYLAAPLDDDKITDQTIEMWLRVHTARFESDRWWFRDSVTGQLIKATVKDDAWLGRIESNEIRVGKNDAIKALVRIEQWDRDDQPDTEHTVIQVLDTVDDAGGQLRFTPPTLDIQEPPTDTT